MADTDQSQVCDNGELTKLKVNLEKYRELLLPLNNVLEWEQNYYPGVLVGIITLIFALIWFFEPSVLTTVCLLGIILSVADFLLPKLLSTIFKPGDWTVVQERQYEAICSRLLHAKQHIIDGRKWLCDLKAAKPKAYLLLTMGVFALLAWFGSLIDNVCLTYMFVLCLSLVPGLRKRGILQRLAKKVSDLRAAKTKTN